MTRERRSRACYPGSCLLFLSFCIMLTCGPLSAQESRATGATVEVKLAKSATNPFALILTTKGEVNGGGAWLYRSFYPRNYRNRITEGDHRVEELGAGGFTKSWEIPDKFKGGRYEVSIWSYRIPKEKCTIPNCKWCAALGFHVYGWLAGKGGEFVEDRTLKITPTISVNDKDIPKGLLVEGTIDNGGAWMILWFFPTGYDLRDPYRNAARRVIFLSEGKCSKTFVINEKYYGGAYEVWLYRNRILKENCEVAGGCALCQRYGEHFEGYLFYSGNKISGGRIKQVSRVVRRR